jgi:hypothetical protein
MFSVIFINNLCFDSKSIFFFKFKSGTLIEMPRKSEKAAIAEFVQEHVRLAILEEEEPDEELLDMLHGLASTRYLYPRRDLLKTKAIVDNLFALDEEEFRKFVRVSKDSFRKILRYIDHDDVFRNNSRNCQTEVRIQLGLALEYMGHYGNGNSGMSLARIYGVGKGTVNLFVGRVIQAVINQMKTKI